MLSSISWMHFLLFIGGATLLWVLYVLRFHILGRHPKKPDGEKEDTPPTKRIWGVREEPLVPPPDQQPTRRDNHLPQQTYQDGKSTPDQIHLPPWEHAYDEGIDETTTDEPSTEEDDADYIALENLALEISELTASLGITTTEPHLLQELRTTIQRYPIMAHPAHQTAINNLVIRCALQDCGIALPLEKAESLWNDTPSTRP